MKLVSVFLTLVTLFFIFIPSSYAVDYFVDSVNGLDSNSGLTLDNQWKTISHALSMASGTQDNPGVIFVEEGTYNIALGETFPLTMDNDIQLIGADRTITIIDATGSGTSVIFSEYKNNVVIDSFVITGGEGFLNPYNNRCGGGIYCYKTVMTIENCSIVNNSAAYGGGLCLIDSSPNISDCIIENNTYTLNSDGLGGSGGGIFCETNSSPVISDCEIKGNTARWGGGLTLYGNSTPQISGCVIENNKAERKNDSGGSGGGIDCETNSSPQITDCEIKNNKGLWGGGIFCYDSSSPKIMNCVISGNEAERASNSGGSGGGIECEKNSSPQITDCEIKNNKGLWGGGIYCYDSSPAISNCFIESNTAEGVIVDVVFLVGGRGGGIVCYNQSSPKIDNCNIKNNSASYGGGINCEASSPTISKCVIENNTAEQKRMYDNGCGGGINCEDDATCVIIDCMITNNKANFGGGIRGLESTITIANCIVEKNVVTKWNNDSVGGNGGGILFSKTSSTISNSKLSENKAVCGGGIICFNDNPKIINCLINNNSASEEGGGINCSQQSSPKINNVTIVDNTAQSGDELYTTSDSKPVLTSCIVRSDSGNPIQGNSTITYSCIKGGYDGEGNIDQDPIFTTGPWGDYYLSQISAGQEADSPCIDKGSEVPIMGFNPKDYITRTDGVGDMGVVDMGYHYPKHVKLGLTIDPVKLDYTSGDTITLRLDVVTAPIELTADIYLIMLDPEGKFYSAMAWNKGLQPLAQSFKLPANLDISTAPLFTFTIPSAAPPVDKSGTYTFYLAALKPGTADFISIIASTGFTVH